MKKQKEYIAAVWKRPNSTAQYASEFKFDHLYYTEAASGQEALRRVLTTFNQMSLEGDYHYEVRDLHAL